MNEWDVQSDNEKKDREGREREEREREIVSEKERERETLKEESTYRHRGLCVWHISTFSGYIHLSTNQLWLK